MEVLSALAGFRQESGIILPVKNAESEDPALRSDESEPKPETDPVIFIYIYMGVESYQLHPDRNFFGLRISF